MNKYIDSEKLIAEIERYKQGAAVARFDNGGENADYFQGKVDLCDDLPHIITSLQQEQPDKYETALEKAREWMPNVNQGGHAILIDIFPELGECLDPRYGGRKQEQPEVDLENEIELAIPQPYSFLEVGAFNAESVYSKEQMVAIARHFYELGLNARKKK